MATSTKRTSVVVKSDDGRLQVSSDEEMGCVDLVTQHDTDGETHLRTSEKTLFDVLVLYFHERGLRRQRKPRTATARKRTTKPAANGAQAITEI